MASDSPLNSSHTCMNSKLNKAGSTNGAAFCVSMQAQHSHYTNDDSSRGVHTNAYPHMYMTSCCATAANGRRDAREAIYDWIIRTIQHWGGAHNDAIQPDWVSRHYVYSRWLYICRFFSMLYMCFALDTRFLQVVKLLILITPYIER